MPPSKLPPPYRILVYGAETQALNVPCVDVVSRKYSLVFEEHKAAPRFQDFDGVIVFQGTFESFEIITGFRSYLKHSCDHDELDKRTKEAASVIEKGGFVCLLMTGPVIEINDGRDFRRTDLSKRLLSGFGIGHSAFNTRLTNVRSKVDELAKFFSIYGAACSSLFVRDPKDPSKTLATVDNYAVSVVADGSMFAIPTLLPDQNDRAVQEYLTMLADSIVALWEHLKTELPAWADNYRFPDEAELLDTRLKLSNEISDIEDKLNSLERLKRVLVLQGEPLVDAVIEVFEKTLPLSAKREEAFREDFVLRDSTGVDVALVEVKGVARGVSREHVNQADSHRARNAIPPEFPSLLIVNTFARSATSITDKDQPVAGEQIQHAARNNVLVLRTLDLLNLASLYASRRLTSERVVELLTKSHGWLRVGEDNAEVLVS